MPVLPENPSDRTSGHADAEPLAQTVAARYSFPMEQKPLLLHCCCGPCSSGSIERLRELGYEPVLFFGNSNIFPPEEADRRYEALRTVADHFSLRLIRSAYDHDAWRASVPGHERDPEGGARCAICFGRNLRETAEQADRLGFHWFTTTLSISPRKSSSLIFTIGKTYEGFVPVDFKKKGGFQRSIAVSRMLGLYRQNYCGCEFSRRQITREAGD